MLISRAAIRTKFLVLILIAVVWIGHATSAPPTAGREAGVNHEAAGGTAAPCECRGKSASSQHEARMTPEYTNCPICPIMPEDEDYPNGPWIYYCDYQHNCGTYDISFWTWASEPNWPYGSCAGDCDPPAWTEKFRPSSDRFRRPCRGYVRSESLRMGDPFPFKVPEAGRQFRAVKPDTGREFLKVSIDGTARYFKLFQLRKKVGSSSTKWTIGFECEAVENPELREDGVEMNHANGDLLSPSYYGLRKAYAATDPTRKHLLVLYRGPN